MVEIKFLEGKKVYLRPLMQEDLTGEYIRWINDTQNDEFTEHAQLPHSLDALVRFAQSKWRDSSCIWLAIIEQGTNQHIGNLELSNIDWVHRKCEFKIIIDKAYQGKGYGTEATRLILRQAFKILNLHKVYLGVHEDNQKARKLYEKLGFVQEGLLRDTFLRDAVWKNSITMGLLAEEFKDGNKD